METVSHLDFIFERHNELNLKIASKLIPISAIKDYKNSFNEVISKLKEKANCIHNKNKNEINSINNF